MLLEHVRQLWYSKQTQFHNFVFFEPTSHTCCSDFHGLSVSSFLVFVYLDPVKSFFSSGNLSFLPKMISLLAFLSPFWIIGTWLFDMVAEASAYGFVNFRSTLWNNRWLLCLLRTSFFSLFCVFGSFGSFEDAEAPDRLCVDRVYACPYIKEVVFELDSAGLVYSGLY